MGRVLEKQVIAISCDLRSCNAHVALNPVPSPSTWHDELPQLKTLVGQGWSLILLARLRAYCPAHPERVWDCSCRTHPQRAHLCTAHSRDAAAMVWDSLTIPNEVETFQALTERANA